MLKHELVMDMERSWRHLTHDDQVVTASRLEHIGQGGSYRIYRMPHAPGLVLKLPYQDSSLSFDVDDLNRDYERLHDSLPEAISPQRAYRARYRWSEDSPDTTGHALLQPFDPWIRTPSTWSLSTGYLESTLTLERLAEYHRLNDDLLGEQAGSWRAALAWLPTLKAIDEIEGTQPGLLAAIARTLPPLVRHMDGLDQLIDLVGDFNVYARHDPTTGWMIRLGTILKYNRMSRTRLLLRTFPDTRAGVEGLDPQDRSLLMNAIAVLRFINALSLMSGVSAPFTGLFNGSQRRALAYLRFGTTTAPYP